MLIKTNTESCLLLAICEELQGLDSQITQNIEKKLMNLDPSHSGIIHQSELTYLLLKQKIPLKLTSLSCIFKSFSDTNNPEKVHYKELLEFIQRATDGHKHHLDEAEIWDLESVTYNDSITENQKDSWLQRFQKMEMAMQMYDIKNTGYIDRDQAKRLLHNYSLIFNLNLSPLKINEVTRYSQQEGKVNLVSALQQLKEL
ncbi:uncharacterized protein [Misgurnus anguillicaudatus]|uniref:uncharacterized protein n=1 Tax=Misgurnus anguillicaudatus TaxID=75329 RepID=UPI003CCF5961